MLEIVAGELTASDVPQMTHARLKTDPCTHPFCQARPLLVAVAAALDPNARSKLVTSGFHTFRCLPLPCIEEAVNAVVSDPFTSQAVKHARLLEMIVEVDMLREKVRSLPPSALSVAILT